MDSEDYHFKLKVTVLGDKSVGKTSLTDCKFNIYSAIINATGKLIESEVSDEISIKVIKFTISSFL